MLSLYANGESRHPNLRVPKGSISSSNFNEARVQIQIYAALIASLLLVAWTQKKRINAPLKCCAFILLAGYAQIREAYGDSKRQRLRKEPLGTVHGYSVIPDSEGTTA